MLNIEIRNLQKKVALNKEKLKKLTEKAASELKINEGDLSVVFVGSDKIKKLNFAYRQLNIPTDVLSFLIDEKPFLGEIIVCPEAIFEKEKKKHMEEKEIEEKVFLRIVHGLLHLCHFDHQTEAQAKEMEAKERKLLKQISV